MLQPGAQQLKRGKCSSARYVIEAPRSDSQQTAISLVPNCVHCSVSRRDSKKQKAAASFVMSVCPRAWNNSAPNRKILMKIDF
jgi:hypothetical protein